MTNIPPMQSGLSHWRPATSHSRCRCCRWSGSFGS